MKTQFSPAFLTAAAAAAILAGCAGVPVSNHSYSDSYKINEPIKSESCYEASVLLARNPADTAVIAAKTLAAFDTTVSERSAIHIKAQRNRNIGLLVGSGGEELQVTFRPVSNDKTFVTVATKTGFVGGAGQKAWSCQVVDQMVSMAS